MNNRFPDKETRKALWRKGMKYCPKCELFRFITKFWRNKSKRDGLNGRCIDCEKIRAKTPKYMALKRKNALKWNKEHPERLRLNQKLYRVRQTIINL